MSLPKLINIKELMRTIGVSRATIYRWMDAGTFPSSIELSPNKVAWFEEDIRTWIHSRPRSDGVNRKHIEVMNEVFR